jgi:phosphatidylglycerol:prolipoprotein diacylglycerol transferase
MVALGFIVAYYAARRDFARYHLPVETLENGIMMLMFSALFGARFVYFAVERFEGLRSDPLSFFRIWEGGLVFYGGFLFGITFLLIYTRVKRLPLLTVLDALTAPLLIGQAFGRLGCFSAGCCYGRPTECFLGVTFTHPESLAPRFVSLHPTQLYSSLGDVLLLGGLYLARKYFKRPGSNVVYYLLGYGTGRFLIEFVRNDDRGVVFAGLFPSQWISLAAILTGVILFFYVRKKETV